MPYTVQYYDLLLGAIAASMVVGVGVGTLTTVTLPAAVSLAGVVAALLIGYGLFVNSPVDTPDDLTDPVETLN